MNNIWKLCKDDMPIQQKPLLMLTKTHEIYDGFWLKDANYKEQNVRRWRIYNPHVKKTLPEEDIIAWCYKSDMVEYLKGILNEDN